jgi:Predicted AAA-ATPase
MMIAEEHGVVLEEPELKDQFRELIGKVARRGKVVLLIDEYDKPIVDYLEQPDRALENRAIMKQFYSILKDADPQLEFVLITGVSKFSKVSIFSDLNNLNDLTMHPAYGTLLGITSEELEDNFGPALDLLAQAHPDVRADVRRWYNGYSWDGQTKVYNPFSILRFLGSGSLQNYWFETGTPTFLINLMRAEGRFVWDSDEFVSLLNLAQFDIEHLDLVTVLFQTGYLTLAEIHFMEGWAKLTYPNREVQASLEQLLLGAYQGRHGSGLPTVLQLRQALERNDLGKVMSVINAAFASIPYDLWRNATELHY